MLIKRHYIDQINDVPIDFYENGMFGIGKTAEQPSNNMVSLATTYVRYGQTYRDYYSWVGVHIFTVAQSLNFTYDYTTAGYGGGYDGWYSRGSILSVWQVSDWSEGHEQAGNNHEAVVSGYFHTGFEYQGFGFVVQDLNIQHTLTCHPDGSMLAVYSIA